MSKSKEEMCCDICGRALPSNLWEAVPHLCVFCLPEKVCEYGHICISECQETKECPCVNDHFCSMGEHEISECLASDDGVCNNHKDSVPDESYNDEDYETRRDNEGEINNFNS